MENYKPISLKAAFIMLLLLFVSTSAFSQLQEAFLPRYSETLKGDLTIIANNTVSLNRTLPYNGGANNNALEMVYVDIDADPTTFNSSSANLVNPNSSAACLTIEKVFLYWTASDLGEIVGGVELDNQPSWNYFDVKLQLPGQTNYNTVRADEVIYRGRDTHFSNDPYICFKDITSQVNNLLDPYGRYQVANVEGKTGSLAEHGQVNSSTGVSGGWQIVVVYQSPDFNLKNISIFDGYAHVTRDRNSFPVSFDGFQTVPNGPVRAEVAIGALEGDRQIAGDRLQIRNTTNIFEDIVAPERPANNFFNSRITIGQPGNDNFTNRNPASLNTLGFDSALFPLRNPGNSIIANNQTSATLRLTSTGETYGLYLLGFSVEVFEPVLVPIIHTASPNPITPSDDPNANVVTYNTQMTNNGNDNAINISFTTNIPLGSELIQPIVGLPAGLNYTYDIATRVLRFTAQNGLLDIGDTLNFDYQVRVNDRCYFLENGCTATLESEMVGIFQGEINGDTQTTGSSNDTDDCGIGNDLPTQVEVNQPDAATWTTPTGELDVTLECDDLDGLNDAQNVTPVADCANLTPIKTSGTFVSDGGTCATNGTYTNTWSFTDACGRTIADFVQVITIQDTTPPDLTLCDQVTDQTLECNGDNNETIADQWNQDNINSLTNCGTDNCDLDAVFVVNSDYDFGNLDTTGACGVGGTLTVNYTVADDCGNEAVRTVTLTLEDSTPPDLETCDQVTDQSIECTGTDNETIANQWNQDNIDALTNCATDECNDAAEYVVTSDYDYGNLDTTGACGIGGTLTVNYTVADDCGNEAVRTVTLTLEDTTPPDLSNCSVENEEAECGTPEENEAFADQWNADNIAALETCAGDACNNDATVTVTSDYDFDLLNTTCGPCGTLTVNYSVKDDCDNETVLTAVLTFGDSTGPDTSNCDVTDETIECGGDLNETIADQWNQDNLDELENCIDDPNVVITSSYDYTTIVTTCGAGGTVTAVYTITDECGNPSSITATLTLEDSTPPVFDACDEVTDQSIECTGTDNETIADQWNQDNIDALTNCATDDCDVDATFVVTSDYDFGNLDTTGACGVGGTLTVNYTVADDCGNEAVRTVTLTLEDTTPPDLETCDQVTDQSIECSGIDNETIADQWNQDNIDALTNCATDECNDAAEYVVTSDYDFGNLDTTGACGVGGTLTVNYTVADDCGNEAVRTVTLTLEDSTGPDVSVCGDVLNETIECGGDENNEAIADQWNTTNLEDLLVCAVDDCNAAAEFTVNSDYDFGNLDTTGACGQGGTLTVNYTVSDDCGNESIVTAVLTLEDTTGPQLVTSIESSISVVCSEVPEVPELEFVDGCTDEEITIQFEETNGDLGDGEDYQVIRTWTVTDICDNTEVYTQTINVTNQTLTNNQTADRCYDDGPIDLFSFLSTNTDTNGEWVIVSAVNDDIEVIDGVFDPSDLDQEEDLGDYVFSYTVTKEYCLENTEVTITLNDDCIVLPCGLEDFTISKALTPNGDQYNQFFEVTSVKDCGFDINIKIFNRYGAIVYQNTDYNNDWSADSHSSSIGGANQLPNGTYYYVIILEGSGFKPLSGPLFIGTK